MFQQRENDTPPKEKDAGTPSTDKVGLQFGFHRIASWCAFFPDHAVKHLFVCI